MNSPKGTPIFLDEVAIASDDKAITERFKDALRYLNGGKMVMISTPRASNWISGNIEITPSKGMERWIKQYEMQTNPDKYPLAKALYGK